MCGIAGFSGPHHKDRLKAMCKQIEHRGPDDEGFYYDDGFSMGMRRLSIIDLETGHQPIHNQDKTIWVTCNGEIYNFLELKSDLQKRGYKFYTKSDSEVLVHLYQEYGDEFLHKINGMYAIAIWDSKKKRLLLARDRLGVKPLYYHVDAAGDIHYGSEIKCILQDDLFDKQINFQALSYYLTYRAIPAPFTIYKGISILRPGEFLSYQEKKLEKRKYWSPDYSQQQDYTEEQAVSEIENLVHDATRVRMISDVPVGAFLSGGVDSSYVVAQMRELTDQPIKTFSMTYDEDHSHKRDSFYARKIAEQFKTDHYEYVMSANDLRENLNKIVWHFDQPFNGVISTFFLSKFAREHVKVALTGDGADDQFGSYAHHRLCWPIENYNRAKALGLPDSEVDFRPFEDRVSYVKEIAEDELAKWRIKFYAFTDEEKLQLCHPDLRESIAPHSSLDLLRQNLDRSSELDSLNRLLDVDVSTLLPDEILTFSDRLSMAHSIELRSPFLDYRFIELVATMPGHLKIKDGIPKYILKKAASKYLSDEILYRPKEGFILPQDSWIRGELKSDVNNILSEDRLKAHGFFDVKQVGKLVSGYIDHSHNNSYKIWNLIMFQLWYETCFLEATVSR